MRNVIGWDIGGVNTKAALVVDGILQRVLTRPFELQKAPQALAGVLTELGNTLSRNAPDAHAVTMTAELSQMFRTKHEGVSFILDAAERAFAGTAIHVYTTCGAFVPPEVARSQTLDVAAANWVATAQLVARHHPDALLVDVGTTTTDVIPISGGRVVAGGRTDPERLASGELVYSGAVRTPVEAIVRAVPVRAEAARVSAEGFALAGDVHVWLGTLAPEDYDSATPDGRPSTRPFCGERLARVVCADRELLDDEAIGRIAVTIADVQVATMADAIRDVIARHPSIDTAVVTGLGAFLGVRALAATSLSVVPLSEELGIDGARSAPATAVALLLNEQLSDIAGLTRPAPRQTRAATNQRITVVKIGGSLLDDPAQWRIALAALSAAKSERLLVVPGGGPFADAVRSVDQRFPLPDDAAHWMAIAGMDQHAEMITASGEPFVRVDSVAGIAAAHRRGAIPVLAPLRWLRGVDSLPHSWDITSDSIAAWVAAQVDAARLVVVKSVGAGGPAIVDPQFARILPPSVSCAICDALALQAQLAAAEPSRR